MGKHSGLEICKVLVDRVDVIDDVTARAGEVDFRTLENLQTTLNDDAYYAIFSPEENTRRVKDRRVAAQEERPIVMLTLVGSMVHEQDMNDVSVLEQFLEKLDDIHHAIFGTTIDLPAPFGRASWPVESVEVPSDEQLSQLSLRIRQLQYPFHVTRSGS
ncbi:MAG: hypothetical protein RIK87_08445 [Fuerstiella sp.]